MSNVFLISDTHFGHANILKFLREDGSRVRVFDNVQQMDDFMVERWNSVVRPQDKIYHLGDVCMGNKQVNLEILKRLNGHKRLIRGNHDDCNTKSYMQYFDEVYACRLLDRLLCTHIPVHPDSIGKSIANVHGHVHNNLSALNLGPRYFNVSVEVIDYTPISLEDVKKRVLMQIAAGESVNGKPADSKSATEGSIPSSPAKCQNDYLYEQMEAWDRICD